jgi:hypothetical protein
MVEADDQESGHGYSGRKCGQAPAYTANVDDGGCDNCGDSIAKQVPIRVRSFSKRRSSASLLANGIPDDDSGGGGVGGGCRKGSKAETFKA